MVYLVLNQNKMISFNTYFRKRQNKQYKFSNFISMSPTTHDIKKQIQFAGSMGEM